MAWIIQSESEGPVIINDIGITLTYRQIRDLDLIGRDNAERSNDLKILLQKGFIRQIKKDASAVGGLQPDLVQKINDSITQAAKINAETVKIQAASEERIQKIEQSQTDLSNKMDTVLDEVRKFAEARPLELKVIAEAMRNIIAERGAIAIQKQELEASGLSETEMKVQEKILSLKDKKLEKNITGLGNTISQSSSDFKEALDALDELDI